VYKLSSSIHTRANGTNERTNEEEGHLSRVIAIRPAGITIFISSFFLALETGTTHTHTHNNPEKHETENYFYGRECVM
jgi:hypothetical protein